MSQEELQRELGAALLAALPPELVDRLVPAVPAQEVRISVVLPVFNEGENLRPLLDRLVAALEPQGSFEVIVVDDGSRDTSLETAVELHRADGRIKVVSLSRNFGHQSALLAGLDHARGRGVVLMDADGQDPPEVLKEMIALWEGGADVVYGVRRHRKESRWRRGAYWLFYRLVQRMADIRLPLDAGDFCIMDRRVVDAMRSLKESSHYLRGLRSWVGFRQVGYEYDRPARLAGRTKYTLGALARLSTDGIFSFSAVPLRLASVLGVLTSLLGFVYVAFAITARVVEGQVPKGWTSIIAIVLIIGGAQLLVIGVLGEYLARVYGETKRRPHYIVGRRWI